MAAHPQDLAQLLDRARTRQLTRLIADQAAIALAVALAGATVLLLLGTQILDWYWLVLLFATSLAIGVTRTLRRAPSSYALAQQIDHRLGLYDALSTAYHFEHTSRASAPDLRAAQRAQADSVARTVDAAALFPFVLPKSLYAAGAVGLVALGLFALRYGVTRSLDLRPSLVRIAFDTFFQPDTRTAANRKSDWRKKLEDELQKLGINLNETDPRANELDPLANNAPNALDSPGVATAGDSDDAKSRTINAPNEQASDEPGESERTSAAGDKAASDQPPDNNDGAPPGGKQAPNPKGAKEPQGQNNSLLDKMRDALSNLMNKLKMNPQQGEGKQSAQQDSEGRQSQGKSDRQQMAGKQQAGGNEVPDPGGQQQAQGEQSQSAQGRSGDPAGQQASQDSSSGIGKQDGDKSSREAEQLAAMGKISEILGKRARDVTGEVMVEVSAGSQQLKTRYSSGNAAHFEAGGEINRDEVPLEYQEYVQQYFEHIRKLPAPAAKKPAAR